ncbi:hypothetical protein BD310DRAFT_979870 [Dichomitus squalens]|uniref:DUF6533 domain-containing protein n=1 Tax=Dichomitus squalens TaxID=114155 RepID=A0A4V2K782_9APHY|nr:hypothetical protein BD310DRAFT_979870 [Dichomitus squalens]
MYASFPPTLGQNVYGVGGYSDLYLLRASKYVKVSSGTLLLLEILSTLPDEAAFVWPGRMSISKALYLFNKYSPLVDQTLDIVTIFQTPANLQVRTRFQVSIRLLTKKSIALLIALQGHL